MTRPGSWDLYHVSSSRFYGSLEVISHVISIVHGDYPLVNIPKNDGKIHHAFLMGKSTVFMGHFQ